MPRTCHRRQSAVILVLVVFALRFVLLEHNPLPFFQSCDPSNAADSYSSPLSSASSKMYDIFEDLGVLELANDNKNNNSNKKSSASIRILQITDLHIFPRECDVFEGIPLQDAHAKCMQLIDSLVKDSQPDVIILTGDIMDGRGPWNSKERVVETVEQMIPFFHDTPWAYLPGNHDDDHSPWTRQELTQILKLPGCIQHQALGFHHTILLSKKLSSSSTTSTRIRLHMFDSGGNHPNKKIMYYCTPSQAIEGFTKAAEARAGEESDVTGLVYIHIPTPEYQGLDPIIGENRLFQAAVQAGKLPPPLDKLVWLIKLLKKDRIAGCTRGQDSGLFPALVHANANYNSNIASVFCGHDHHSDAIFWKQGIFLGYGRSGSLTPPYDWEGKAPNPLQPGARVAEISSEGILKTWMHSLGGVEHDSLLDMTNFEPKISCCWP